MRISVTGSPENGAPRLASVDLVRGAAMVLMAVDHVRVYAGVPSGGTEPAVFFTRWITNFVAPWFVFLAGTAVFLHGRRLADRAALGRFLLLRGAWLIFLELTVIRVAWTFNFNFSGYLLAGVIWAIGFCMMLMAAAVRLPSFAVGGIGISIAVLHNVADLFRSPLSQIFGPEGPNWFFRILYFGGQVRLGQSGPPLFVLYSILPWLGIMMCGYAFGKVMEIASARRRLILIRLGTALALLFIALRALNVYGDPHPWNNALSLQFLAATKYPASLLFLLMTLGPMFILLAFAERWRGRPAEALAMFGRVPLFYYILHIPLIHLSACFISLVREGRVNPWLFGNHPLAAASVPPGYTWDLWLLYAVFAVCVGVMYFPCRRYARLRATAGSEWLSYF